MMAACALLQATTTTRLTMAWTLTMTRRGQSRGPSRHAPHPSAPAGSALLRCCAAVAVCMSVCLHRQRLPAIRNRLLNSLGAERTCVGNNASTTGVRRRRLSSGGDAAGTSRRALRRQAREEALQRRRLYYERGTYWGMPAAAIVFQVARAMHLDRNALLWCETPHSALRGRAPGHVDLTPGQTRVQAGWLCHCLPALPFIHFVMLQCARSAALGADGLRPPPLGDWQVHHHCFHRPAGPSAHRAREVLGVRAGAGNRGALLSPTDPK
jgi:hypothetical protein